MTHIWQLTAEVSQDDVSIIENALAPFLVSLSIFETQDGGKRLITGIIRGFPDHADIKNAFETCSSYYNIQIPCFEINLLPETDWLAKNRASFPTLHYGRFFIHGSNQRGLRPMNAIAVEIDAGRAFGSGTHGSTEGCLWAINSLARFFRPSRVLDLGCGSGILGISAALLWRRAHITALDLDIEAVKTTRENSHINKVKSRILSRVGDGYPRVSISESSRFDLVLANILAAPLISMAFPSSRQIRRGGMIVLSGLLTNQEREVIAAYKANKFSLFQRHRIFGWSTLVLRR